MLKPHIDILDHNFGLLRKSGYLLPSNAEMSSNSCLVVCSDFFVLCDAKRILSRIRSEYMATVFLKTAFSASEAIAQLGGREPFHTLRGGGGA